MCSIKHLIETNNFCPFCFTSENIVMFLFILSGRVWTISVMSVFSLHDSFIHSKLHLWFHVFRNIIWFDFSLHVSVPTPRLLSTSQAPMGIPELLNLFTTSTLRATMNIWQLSGQWVMSSRTMIGKYCTVHYFIWTKFFLSAENHKAKMFQQQKPAVKVCVSAPNPYRLDQI